MNREWEKGRASWSYEENQWGDPAIDVTMVVAGIRFAITEDKAVDSYNQEFTCSICLPPRKARELAELVLNYLDAKEPTEQRAD
jgi:hypothetical protein